MNLSSFQKDDIAIEYNKWHSAFSPITTMSGETESPEYLQFEELYSWISDDESRKILSLMHSKYVTEFRKMNTRLPTQDDSAYF